MHCSKLVAFVATLALLSAESESHAVTLTTLASLNATIGIYPNGGLTLSGSALYGMTIKGGTSNDGTVFALALAPEPSSIVLLGFGAIALGATALRRKMRTKAA